MQLWKKFPFSLSSCHKTLLTQIMATGGKEKKGGKKEVTSVCDQIRTIYAHLFTYFRFVIIFVIVASLFFCKHFFVYVEWGNRNKNTFFALTVAGVHVRLAYLLPPRSRGSFRFQALHARSAVQNTEGNICRPAINLLKYK